jgi:hypothetical protein
MFANSYDNANRNPGAAGASGSLDIKEFVFKFLYGQANESRFDLDKLEDKRDKEKDTNKK